MKRIAYVGRRDRLTFLCEQLKVNPLTAAEIASIPDLYQPPDSNQANQQD